jgi:hypothetical protein
MRTLVVTMQRSCRAVVVVDSTQRIPVHGLP